MLKIYTPIHKNVLKMLAGKILQKRGMTEDEVVQGLLYKNQLHEAQSFFRS